MKRLIVLTALTGALLAGCGGSGHSYPPDVEHNFLVACENSATASQCNCMLDKIEAKVSLHEFVQADAAANSTAESANDLPSWLYDAAAACQ